ncbi:hypothetical protein HDU76_010165 [Blyttiomyces sp. JEL0837]|nr:hypothetical protein HDU76_010165 [Blyttiomyces sp. JEL0837]
MPVRDIGEVGDDVLTAFRDIMDETKGNPWILQSNRTTFPHPPTKIQNILLNTTQRPTWDHVMATYKLLPSPTPSTPATSKTYTITYTCTKPILGGLISARDYIDLRVTHFDEDKGSYIMAWSGVNVKSNEDGEDDDDELEYINGFDLPEELRHEAGSEVHAKSGIVRGFNFPGGVYIVPVDSGSSKVYYTVQSDIKGQVPVWLVNKGTGGALESIFANLKKYLQQHKDEE